MDRDEALEKAVELLEQGTTQPKVMTWWLTAVRAFLRAYAEATPPPVEPAPGTGEGTGLVTCEGCGNEIDPDTCGCGDSHKNSYGDGGHPHIPLGCDCYRAERRAAPSLGAATPTHGGPPMTLAECVAAETPAAAEVLGALRKWKCDLCGGCGSVPLWRYNDDVPVGSGLAVTCRTCEGTGLHGIARAALAAWKARKPLADDQEALRAVGDEIAAHLMINLPRNQRDFVAAGALRAIDRALSGSRS